MSAVTFSGDFIKALKSQFNLNDNAYILTGSDDPTSVAKDAPAGSLYINSNNKVFKKLDAGSSTNWVEVISTSESQALTNKTIDADSNTISNLEHGAEVDNPSSGVHGVIGSVVGTSDTQTFTNKSFDDAITTQQIVTPSNPASGYNKIYIKSNNLLYSLSSSGVETEYSAMAPVGVVMNVISKSTNYTILDDDDLGFIIMQVTAAGLTLTLPNPANNIGRVIRVKVDMNPITAHGLLTIARNNSSDKIDSRLEDYYMAEHNQTVSFLCFASNQYYIL